MQIVGGIAVGLLLVGLSGAAVSGLTPARFGVGGAVNNGVRQLGGVFGTALAVVLVGQTGAGIDAFRTAFLCLGVIGLAVAVLCLSLPRMSGRVVPQTAA
jgi:MFS family permease